MNRVDIRTQNKLLTHYPDKHIVGLRRDHYSLYQMIFAIAKKKGMNHKTYLESLGFYYEDKRNIDDDEIQDRLLMMYRNRVVEKLTQKNKNLYQLVVMNANRKGIEIKDYLESLGFEYKDSRINDEFNSLYDKLLKLYPDKKVKNFQKYRSYYIKIYRLAKQEGLTVMEYLYNIGFDYVDTKKQIDHVFDEKIKNELEKLYPDKVIVNLSKNNDNIYKKVQKASYRKNCDIEKYLKSLGFDYVGGRKVVKKKELIAL